MLHRYRFIFLAFGAAAIVASAETAVVALRSDVSPSRRPDKFTCLPKDVRAEETVSYGRKASQEITVEQKLREMKASCRNGKLVDARGREIRFFRPSCWGNPPPDYLE